jgi:quercetin dioxygenase-like cupin family protein
MSTTPVVASPQGSEAWWFLGTLAIIKVDGKHTGGRFALFETLLPKEAAPPVHSHPQDETFQMLEGQVTVWIDGLPSNCDKGSTVFVPAGVPHTFFVKSESARMLILSTPAGIEELVRAASIPATELRLPDDDVYPDRETIDAVMAAHGVKIFGPPPTAGIL